VENWNEQEERYKKEERERSKREAKTKSKANKRKIKEGRPKKEERNEVGKGRDQYYKYWVKRGKGAVSPLVLAGIALQGLQLVE
jgi:hypothetical protein